MSISRRQFLTYAGFGTLATLGTPLLSGCGRRLGAGGGSPPFPPITHSREDRFLLPEGYNSQIVAAWGDDLGIAGPDGKTFGFNCDFNAFFPMDALSGGHNASDGLLWTNHEYPDPVFVSQFLQKPKKLAQILAEKESVGGSIIRVRRDGAEWKRVPDEKYTRRFSALGPMIELSGPAARIVPQARGTLANCSGGATPWHTVLSCEENFDVYNDKYRWADVPSHKIDERGYGWVVEVDPFGELPPVKHSALGRFAHENVAWRLGPTNRLVLYMGDDAMDQHLYKFVSAAPYREQMTRLEKRRLLEEGTLYVAEFGAGEWLPLDIKRSGPLQSAGFKDQADVMLRARQASVALGGTPLDRPEDCEIHPLDGTLYVALTNNANHGNYYGQIVRLLENGDNPEGETFRYEIFLAGGSQSGLACPDNLAFDKAGNLWVATDMSSKSMGEGALAAMGNNGLFFVPTRGADAGEAFQFASAPIGAELTGPWFTPDESTLFLSVQHPGEGSMHPKMPLSNWPEGGNAMPKPSVVAISGF